MLRFSRLFAEDGGNARHLGVEFCIVHAAPDQAPVAGLLGTDPLTQEGDTECACAAGPGLTTTSDDCNDANDTIYPGASELCNGATKTLLAPVNLILVVVLAPMMLLAFPR